MASLSGASYVADSFILRNSFNALLRVYGTRPVVNTTIYNYFFNLSDPVLELTKTIVPFLVPTKETGILQNVCLTLTLKSHCQQDGWFAATHIAFPSGVNHDAAHKNNKILISQIVLADL